jgi:hypothetical protein
VKLGCTAVPIFAMLCLTASRPAYAQTYTSTTTITASSSNGDISGAAGASWDNNDCMDTFGEATLTLDLQGQNFVIGDSGNDTDATFQSNNLGFVYGPGSYVIGATFSGFSSSGCSVTGSSGSTTVVVPAPVSSITQLVVPSTPVRAGQPVSITANVTGANSYNVGPAPTGTIVLFYQSRILASAKIQPGSTYPAISSSATFNLSSAGIPPGAYSVTAVYNGDNNLTGSSSYPATVTISAAKVATTTGLSASPTVAASGQLVTLSATVTSNISGSTPTGMVTFLYGTRSLGTAALNSQGVATLTESTTGIPAGNYNVTAAYAGDAYDDPSTSSPQTVTVQNSTTTALSVYPGLVASGEPVTLTATVTRTPGSGTPTGTVNFSFEGYNFGSATLNSQGAAIMKFSTQNLGSGSYSITATYAGDALDSGSTSSPVTLTVQ